MNIINKPKNMYTGQETTTIPLDKVRWWPPEKKQKKQKQYILRKKYNYIETYE